MPTTTIAATPTRRRDLDSSGRPGIARPYRSASRMPGAHPTSGTQPRRTPALEVPTNHARVRLSPRTEILGQRRDDDAGECPDMCPPERAGVIVGDCSADDRVG